MQASIITTSPRLFIGKSQKDLKNGNALTSARPCAHMIIEI